MTPRRLLAALVPGLLLSLAAAPAQATLLVRSDGAGLTVLDKNNISEDTFIGAASNGRYEVVNNSAFDVFRFDRQTGCGQGEDNFSSFCIRDNPTMNVGMAGGDDRLDMDGGAFTTAAPTGSSSVNAGGGDDRVVGHAGRDHVVGFSGADRFEGRAGNDHLEGGDDSDTLIGDGGADTLEAGNNNDTIRSKEADSAVADTLSCGSGTDYVEADLRDTVFSNCEQRDISAVGETPLVRLPRGRLTVRASRHVRLRLRCPRGVGRIGCRGRLSLRLNVRGARRTRNRYGIGAGKSEMVTLRLSRGSARTLRSRQRRGRRTLGVLSSVESGRLGRKTRVRYPRLRLR